MDSLKDLEGQKFEVDLGSIVTFLIPTLCHIQANAYTAAMKNTRILAHLKGENEEEAVEKTKLAMDKLYDSFVTSAINGFMNRK